MYFQHSYIVFGGLGADQHDEIDILSTTGFGPEPLQKLSGNDENQRKSSKTIDYQGYLLRSLQVADAKFV